MTCYFRHLRAVFEEAGISVTKENRKKIDETIHDIVGVDYKNCSETWKQVKDIMKDDESREAFILKLRNSTSNL
ncbi:MAG: hypothetical protein JSW01_02540 [Candidatus Bathyarchaeota archaeon]|nr:MAG: hypothetical protein JSW01_02540 [Candidatus Bathyarchaeota archaeon]